MTTGEATCQCRVGRCRCDGIADLAEYGYDYCGCCIAGCPSVHDEAQIDEPTG